MRRFRVTVEMTVGEFVNAMPLTDREGVRIIASFFEHVNVGKETIDGHPITCDLKSIQ